MNHSHHNRYGFTIIELLIALALSLFIMTAAMQSYRSLMTSIATIKQRNKINHTISLLFDLFEKDLSALIIPGEHHFKEQSDNRSDKHESNTTPPQQPPEHKDDDDAAQKKSAEMQNFMLILESDDDLKEKHFGEKWRLVQSLSGVTLHIFQNETSIKKSPLRIRYELKKEKLKKTGGKDVYTLFRHETSDLSNYECKLTDDAPQSITTMKLAENIKYFSIKFITEKPDNEPSKSTQTPSPQEYEMFFSWGKEHEYGNKLPLLIEVMISFWNEKMTDEYAACYGFPVYNFFNQTEDQPHQEPAPPQTDGPDNKANITTKPAPQTPAQDKKQKMPTLTRKEPS